MKKLSRVLFITASVLLGIVGLAFAFIEGRLLLSGDWLLYESEFLGFLQYFLRFSISAAAVFLAVFSIVKERSAEFIFEGGILTASALVLLIFASNGFGLYFLLLTLLYLGAAAFKWATHKK